MHQKESFAWWLLTVEIIIHQQLLHNLVSVVQLSMFRYIVLMPQRKDSSFVHVVLLAALRVVVVVRRGGG